MKKFFVCAVAIIVAMFYMCGCDGNNERGRKKTHDTVPVEDTTPRIKPNVNVYVENSGSMDGYVKGGVTDFENIIYSYLSDIKISGLTDTLNLFYINSEVYPYASDTSVDVEVLRDFIEKLEPETFKARGSKGGKRGTSDISQIIESVLKRTGEHDISIMITDGIFSPGKNKKADEYLQNQEVGIKIAMANHLKRCPETMVVLYMMTSKFTGTYYDKTDKKYNINGEDRPFYMWIFGQYRDLVDLRNEIPDNKFKGNGVVKKFEISKLSADLNYRIKPVGKKDKDPIYEIKKDDEVSVKKQSFGYKFIVQVDYNDYGLILGDDYLLDADNYQIGDTTVSVKVKKLQSNNGYSHELSFELSKDFFPRGSIEKELKVWFNDFKEDWSDVNDDEGGPAVYGKTYGIKYQVEGICDAYSSKDGRCAEMTFKVRKSN